MTTEREAVAGVQVLIAVARADGTLRDEEKRAIDAALAGVKLPEGSSVEALLSESTDVDRALAEVTSPEVRDAVFRAAVALAAADGEHAPAEGALIDRIQQAFGVSDETRRAVERLVAGATRAEPVPAGTPVEAPADADVRRLKAIAMVDGAAFWAALLAAIPVPIVSGIAVLVVQRSLVDKLVGLYGRKLTRAEQWSVFGATMGLSGLFIAVDSVVKLVPFWGSVASASSSFIVTGALGGALRATLEQEGAISSAALRKAFEAAKASAEAAYERDKGAIEAATKSRGDAVAALYEEARAGRIDGEEFARRLEALRAQGA